FVVRRRDGLVLEQGISRFRALVLLDALDGAVGRRLELQLGRVSAREVAHGDYNRRQERHDERKLDDRGTLLIAAKHPHATSLTFCPVNELDPEPAGQVFEIALLPVNFTSLATICMQFVFSPALPLNVRSAFGK